MKPYLHTTFPKPLLFSYVQLGTKLQVLICLMCTSHKQRCQLKQNTATNNNKNCRVFFYINFWLTNTSLNRDNVVFPLTYFLLHPCCSSTQYAYERWSLSDIGDQTHRSRGSKAAIWSHKITLKRVASFQDATYWSQRRQVGVFGTK